MRSYGLTVLPDALANRADGREAARRLTGKSTVPVLELDDGTAIWDSKRIVRVGAGEPGGGVAMARTYDVIDERLRGWIARQPLYFVGTAPRADDGHVNVSPKGPIGTLRVLDESTIAYLDVVGSGAETIAHLRENGRIVVMLCAFEGPPRIVRLHGRGRVVAAGSEEFDALLARGGFDSRPPTRRAAR